MTIAAITFLIVLGALTVFQLALICGAPIGKFAWGGQHRVLPARMRIGSVISIVIYLIMAAFVLSKSGLWVVIPDETVVTIGLWVMCAYFVVGIVMNAMSRSKLERAVMVPVASVLAVCTMIIVMTPAPVAVDDFQSCKDAGGIIMESYPEQCTINGASYTNPDQSTGSDNYIGLTEQAAMDKAKSENKAARVVERDGESLAVTMDFSPGRLNLYIQDGTVYKVVVEGE